MAKDRGGYFILDLGGANLTSETTIISGVYDKIESTRKAIILSNFELAGVDQCDKWVNFKVDSGNFVAEIGDDGTETVYIHITADDQVDVYTM